MVANSKTSRRLHALKSVKDFVASASKLLDAEGSASCLGWPFTSIFMTQVNFKSRSSHENSRQIERLDPPPKCHRALDFTSNLEFPKEIS